MFDVRIIWGIDSSIPAMVKVKVLFALSTVPSLALTTNVSVVEEPVKSAVESL